MPQLPSAAASDRSPSPPVSGAEEASDVVGPAENCPERRHQFSPSRTQTLQLAVQPFLQPELLPYFVGHSFTFLAIFCSSRNYKLPCSFYRCVY